MEFKERKLQLKLERRRLELETDRSGGEEEEANQAAGASVIFVGARSPDLSHFIERKDDFDRYVLRFKRYATVADWPQNNWATQLSTQLSFSCKSFGCIFQTLE